MKHGGVLDLGSSQDIRVVSEFVSAAQSKSSAAMRDTAGAVVAGVLSAALFSRKKGR